VIQLTNITLHFGARPIFEDLTLSIKPGEKIGLIGRNGTGKSTLLKVISGDISTQKGQISMPSGYRTGYLAQTVELDDATSVRDVCRTAFSDILDVEERLQTVQQALEQSSDAEAQMKLSAELNTLYERHHLLGAAQIDEEVEKVLKGMGFSESQIDEPVGKLSGGWKMRVELARLLLEKPELLLLDEPTNHLDIESILWFEDHLRNYEGTVIVVSHDQHVLNNVSSRTIEITHRSVYDFPYPYSQAMEKKMEQQELLASAYANQQREIAHKERLIDKFRAKASKAKFAKALQSELNRMEIVDYEDQKEKSMRLTFGEGARAGRVIFKASNLHKHFGEKRVIQALDLTIERGERIAFVGQNGQGKTTLARMMARETQPTAGELREGHQIQVGYYAQDQTDRLDNKQTVLSTLSHAASGETEGQLRSILGSLLFEGDEVTKKVSVLSGGERARLSFACMVVQESNVLILDEPTNHLDIPSKEILKDALKRYQGTLIVVSHDMEFLRGLTTRTLEFCQGKIHKHLYDIEEFLRLRRVENLRELERHDLRSDLSGGVSSSVVEKEGQDQDSGGNREMRKRVKQLEREIEKLEAKKAGLEQEMSATDFYNREDITEVTVTYDKTRAQLEALEAEWGKLYESLQ
jgi:ATP-binding cassette subfamily F protein 3